MIPPDHPQQDKTALEVPPVFTLLDPPETNTHRPNAIASVGAEPGWDAPDRELLEYEPGVSFRHSGWRRDRRRVYDALRETSQTLNRLVDFQSCGKHAYVLQSVDAPDNFVIGGSTCHDRFCLPCGRERSRRIASNVIDKLEKEQARFLTLTLKSGAEPLAELLQKLNKDFASLRRTRLWRNKVTGGVAFTEVKWNPAADRWHPHLHCLVQGRYLPKDELSKLWFKITGTSHIIDIRFVHDNAIVTHYVAKYAAKPMDHTVLMDPDRLCEAILALKGKRLCMTFGTWRGYCLTKSLDDGKWINLGLLSEIVTRATQGDHIAQEILDGLEVPYTPISRAPPADTTPPIPAITFEQSAFPCVLEQDPYFKYD